MERVLRVFQSQEEADRAERAYFRSLTPQQRLDILLEIVDRHRRSRPPDEQEFKKAYRVVEFPGD